MNYTNQQIVEILNNHKNFGKNEPIIYDTVSSILKRNNNLDI